MHKIIKYAPGISAICLLISMCASVVYDYWFFYTLGANFSVLPLTIADHLLGIVTWVVPVVIGAFCIFVLEMITRRVEQGMTEQEIIDSTPDPKKTESRRYAPFNFIYIVAALALFVDISFHFFVGLYFVDLDSIKTNPFAHSRPIYSIILWFWLSPKLFNHPRIFSRTSHTFRMIVHFVPPTVIALSFFAVINAEKILNDDTDQYVFENNGNKTIAPLIRVNENYLLIWDAKHEHIKTLKASEVSLYYNQPKIANRK